MCSGAIDPVYIIKTLLSGADGVLIEVHPHPEEALSDGAQSLEPARFAALMRGLRPVAAAVGRVL